ncbi:MAG: hypothetical protein M3071_12640 [Actinomycetota bacterium]|nr:hypothetical protein [Actinomycetota bacterium]
MKTKLAAGAAALIAAVGFLTLGGNGHPSTAKASSAPTSMSASQIRTIALNFATAAGDPTPTSIEYVASTRAAANQALYGGKLQGDPTANDPSYVIVQQGSFREDHAPRPPQASVPTGSVLVVVVNASTGQMTDLSLGQTTPSSLASLGTVIPLAAPQQAAGSQARTAHRRTNSRRSSARR